MKKLLLLSVSFCLIMFATGVSFADVGSSDVSIDKRISQLVAVDKTVDAITQTLLNEGFLPSDIADALVSSKLAKNSTEADKIVDSNSDILGYTPPAGTGGGPGVRATPRFVPTINGNAGSFASGTASQAAF